jgi:hypothetical protein
METESYGVGRVRFPLKVPTSCRYLPLTPIASSRSVPGPK